MAVSGGEVHDCPLRPFQPLQARVGVARRVLRGQDVLDPFMSHAHCALRADMPIVVLTSHLGGTTHPGCLVHAAIHLRVDARLWPALLYDHSQSVRAQASPSRSATYHCCVFRLPQSAMFNRHAVFWQVAAAVMAETWLSAHKHTHKARRVAFRFAFRRVWHLPATPCIPQRCLTEPSGPTSQRRLPRNGHARTMDFAARYASRSRPVLRWQPQNRTSLASR